jgi:hypothetical protein
VLNDPFHDLMAFMMCGVCRKTKSIRIHELVFVNPETMAFPRQPLSDHAARWGCADKRLPPNFLILSLKFLDLQTKRCFVLHARPRTQPWQDGFSFVEREVGQDPVSESAEPEAGAFIFVAFFFPFFLFSSYRNLY